ncbi:protein kinase family protein [Ornithinibacillus contaminans]|uniref:hypothetical protein n=1 Tax=Ornithinibacillus contaminans TaxID=694055 RepID=UPI00069F7B90|nr:hypothetical protein [Ornithinibacillus contaminans]
MKELLLTNYNIYVKDYVSVLGRTGFRDQDYTYFIINATNKEMIQMEQAALAYYLSENGYNHTALPIPTNDNKWFVNQEDNRYLVLRVAELQENLRDSHGVTLAQFHEKTAAYPYEPKEISSYGLWKNLWINKLTAFEQKIQKEAIEHPTDYYRLLIDVLPYLVGISENAIQYIQESESDKRYHYGDQGVFTFQRYKENLVEPVIWTDELVYDHPSRDLAEFIRYKFLENDEKITDEVVKFMSDYQSIRPLSVFSWRLLYARLVFPIHLFDFIERCFYGNDFDQYHVALRGYMERQKLYEQRLGQLYDVMEVDYKSFDIPIIQWLS